MNTVVIFLLSDKCWEFIIEAYKWMFQFIFQEKHFLAANSSDGDGGLPNTVLQNQPYFWSYNDFIKIFICKLIGSLQLSC